SSTAALPAECYAVSLHDALPISEVPVGSSVGSGAGFASTGHPWLTGRTTIATTGTDVLTGVLSVARAPWMADHAVAGRTVVSGTAWLDLVAGAGRAVGCPEIAELTLVVPVTLPAAGDVEVQVVVESAPTGSARRALTVHVRSGAV